MSSASTMLEIRATRRSRCENMAGVDIVFERTGRRSYAIEIRGIDEPLRMDPAPGFDEWFPHDLQHLIVEEQLGLTDGIYGRLAKGGTASTFHPVRPDGRIDDRAEARKRRKLQRRNERLATTEGNDFAQSERTTLVAYHDWLRHVPDPARRRKADRFDEDAATIVARVDQKERAALLDALPRLRERITEVTTEWRNTEIGGSITIPWAPVDRSTRGR